MVFILGGEGGGKSRGCLVLLLLQPTNRGELSVLRGETPATPVRRPLRGPLLFGCVCSRLFGQLLLQRLGVALLALQRRQPVVDLVAAGRLGPSLGPGTVGVALVAAGHSEGGESV